MAPRNYILAQLCWLPSLVLIYLLATYLIQNELQVLDCKQMEVAEVREAYRAVLLLVMALAAALAIALQWCISWGLDHYSSVNAKSLQKGGNENVDPTEQVPGQTQDSADDEAVDQTRNSADNEAAAETQNAANDESEDTLSEDLDLEDEPAEGLIRFDLTPSQVKLIERLLEQGPPAEGMIRFEMTETEAELLEQMIEERELLASHGFR